MNEELLDHDNLKRYTTSQKKAILTTGKDVLVSASAGSGKTMVLIERILNQLKSGINIDELLVVTFTEAAAKEMKERLLLKLKETISIENNIELRSHLIHQLDLVPSASISTLHAFCLQTIRQFFYLIDIDPVFRILTDETEQLLIREDVWEEVREKYYQDKDDVFYKLAINFSNDRSDEGLTSLVFSLYSFSRSNPYPEKWLDEVIKLYEPTDTIDNHPLFKAILKPNLVSQLNSIIKNYQLVIADSEGTPELDKRRQQLVKENSFVEQLADYIENEELESAYWLIQNTSFERLATIKKTDDEMIKLVAEQMKDKRNQNKDSISSLQDGFFSQSPDDMLDVLSCSYDIVEKLVEVINEFSAQFFSYKTEHGTLDFNDLEHLTLQILQEKNGDEYRASEASRYYRNKFKEVLVDEYQDTNQLQEQILFWLRNPSIENGNYFMVGDVKQSIYAFRQADPTLFISKYNKFESNTEGERIILGENFRSRSEILSFTNLIFSQLMDVNLGKMVYDDNTQLKFGFSDFPDSTEFAPEILIYTSEKNEDGEDDTSIDTSFDSKTDGELSIVANKINHLIQSEFQLYDKTISKMRKASYSDIVLLTPTRKNNLTLLEIFKQHGIPVHVNDAQNFFQATEIQTMISLLKIIDNPYQDIPLVAILRSAIVGLNENELAYIRLFDKVNSFYDAFQKIESNNILSESVTFHMPPSFYNKVELFKSQLKKWRRLSSKNNLATLIWSIYQETSFLDYVGGLPSGNQRQANLQALYERASSYEEMSYRGLFQFIRFIEEMQSRNKDLAEPTSLDSEEDAVRVMTIHGSKGLEFPIVFVLDTSKKFNFTDLNQRYVFDSNLGLGIQYLDERERVLYPTLPYYAIREEKKKKILSEEMRKLYVALTRAEQKLYIVGSYNSEEKAWNDWEEAIEENNVVLSASIRENNSSFLKWIGMTLVRHPNIDCHQNHIVRNNISSIANKEGIFEIYFYNDQDIFAEKELYKKNKIKKSEIKQNHLDKSTKQQLKEILSYEYGYNVATKTTSYQSVSEIKRLFEDPDESNLLKLDISTERPSSNYRYVLDELSVPNFIETSKAPSAAEIGTATHLMMQLVDLSKPISMLSLSELRDQLVIDKRISSQVAKKINLTIIDNFFQSPFGLELIKNSHVLKKEQPFSMLLSAREIFESYPPASDDEILIHGIIDGYYETSDELVLFDYKTDYIYDKDNKREVETIVKKYIGQMNLYKTALEFTLNRKVTKTNIVLLSIGEVVEINPQFEN